MRSNISIFQNTCVFPDLKKKDVILFFAFFFISRVTVKFNVNVIVSAAVRVSSGTVMMVPDKVTVRNINRVTISATSCQRSLSFVIRITDKSLRPV